MTQGTPQGEPPWRSAGRTEPRRARNGCSMEEEQCCRSSPPFPSSSSLLLPLLLRSTPGAAAPRASPGRMAAALRPWRRRHDRGRSSLSKINEKREKASCESLHTSFFSLQSDLVSLFFLFDVRRRAAGRVGKMAPSRSPRATSAWRSKSAAAAAAVLALLLLVLLLSNTSDGASASTPSTSTTSSSAAASVSLHAKWEAAPLVLEAVEFLVRCVQERDRN